MDNDILRKVQMTQLEIAKEIKRVCDILKIDYFLDAGTLLGAVRHQGFIPWDDDLDIGMLRNDYNRFVKEAGNVLDERYFLQTWESDKFYGLPFAKVRKNGTIYLEEAARKEDVHCGVFVDIFPYDTYPDEIVKQKKQKMEIYILKRAILAKCRYKPWFMSSNSFWGIFLKKMLYLFAFVIFAPVSKRRLILLYDLKAQKYNSFTTQRLYNQDASTDYGEWVIPQKCVSSFCVLQFENEDFKCPIGYIDFLSQIYGNYNELPPEEERFNRHKIYQVKL